MIRNSTLPPVRLNSGWSDLAVKANCILALLALGASSVFADTVTIESRVTTTGAITPNPPYLEIGQQGPLGTGWGSSSAKSTAPGCTATTGSRFYGTAAPTPAFVITPTLGSVNAVYAIYITYGLTATTESASIVVAVSATGGTLSTNRTLAFQHTSSADLNVWRFVGYITNTAANPAVTFTYSSGTQSRFYADAVQFRNLADVCLTGYPQISTVNGPLAAGQTSVQVPGLNAAASAVTVYANGLPIGTNTSPTIAGGVATVNTAPLVKGQIIAATQSSNTVESCLAATGQKVGGGANPRVRIALSIRQNTALTGPIGADGGLTGAKLTFLGSTGTVGGGFGNAPSGGKVFSPNGCWQTVSFQRGPDPLNPVDATFAWSGSDGTGLLGNYGVLEAIAFAVDDLTDSGPFNIYIDNLMNGPTLIQDFESFNAGTSTVVFNQPSFSGSTTPFLLAQSPGSVSPNVSQVSNANADTGTNSARISWQFKDSSAVDWVRLTTQGSAPNPEVDLNQPISFRMLLLPVGQTTASSPVSITTQPASQIAHPNADVMLSVSASGTGTLVYQWYKNGVAIPSANSSTYDIPSAQTSDVASYTVTVSGDPPSCAGTSQAAVLGLASGPATTNVLQNRVMTLAVTKPASVAATYQWSKSTDNGANYTPLAGATNATYSQFVDLPDDGTLFRVALNLASGSITADTTLHVVADMTVPILVSAGAYDPLHIGIVYNERMDFQDHVGGAGDAGLYIAYPDVGDPITVASVIPRTNTLAGDLGQSAVLVTGIVMPPGHYILVAYDFADLAGNESGNLVDGATGIADFTLQSLTPVDVGIAGTNGAGVYNAGAIPLGTLGINPFSGTNGGLDVVANGWDIWNGNDGFHYDVARAISGNFDLKVRVQTLVGADQWSKAGLMVRENTNATSRFTAMVTTPATTPVSGQAANNFFSFQWRDVDGANVTPVGAQGELHGVPPVRYPNAWVRLQRLGSVFNGYQSSNGVDWVLVGSRDTALSTTGVFPDTLLIGLSTVSHDQVVADGLSRNAYAEYREFNIPTPPTITVQPSPLATTQSVNTAISFSVAATNPANSGPLTYQWLKNGVPIPGATSDTLAFASLAVTDTGIYSVDPANNGGATLSAQVSLTVTNVLPQIVSESMNATQGQSFTLSTAALLANDGDPDGDTLSILGVSGSPVAFPVTAATNFNVGNLAGASLYGNASILPTGGTANSGHLELTPAVNAQSGSMILNELTAGVPVYGFTATFNLRISGGTTEPADGFSFNFANNLLNNAVGDAAAEDGEGTGFSFCVDNYRFLPFVGVGSPKGPGASTTANSSGMKLVYHGTNIAGISMPTAWTNTSYIPVSITVTPAGVATIMVNGTNVFGNITLPGYVPTVGRFGMYARTGGLNEVHWVDDLVITTLAPTATALGGSVTFDGANLTYTPPTNQCGSDTIYYLVSDGQAGGQAVDQVDVSVYPRNAPTILFCPANRALAVGANCLASLPDMTSLLVVTDSCCCAVVSQSPPAGTLSGLGTTLVTFTASNIAGLTATCQTIVTNVDRTAPTLVCPAVDIVAECTGNGAIVAYPVTATDNCDANPLVSCTPLASGSPFPVGQTTVNCTATDASGNISSCSFHVTVADTIAPQVTCANVTNECSGAAGTAVTFSPTVVEVCDPSPTNICTPPSGSLFALGPTPVHCASTDHSGNTGSCDFTVTVRDTIAPALICPTNEVVECAGAGGTVATYITPGAIDTCDASPTVSCTPASGSIFALGTNTVTCIAYDGSLNTNTCTFTIAVRDATAPALTCPANLTLECTGVGGAVATYTPVATDDCDGNPSVSCSPASGSTFTMGTSTVTCAAYDASLNTNTCTFTVTVRDTTAPVLLCPDKVVECTGVTGAVVTFAPTVTEACDPNPTNTCTPPSGSVFASGATPVHCTSTDVAGNSGSCNFTVTVRDTIAPALVCPANQTNECTSASGAVATYIAPDAIDLCDASPTVDCSPAAGSTFAPGTNTVTCIAYDLSLNTNSCTFTIIVRDTTAPSITCANARTVECGSAWTFNGPSASDACGTPIVSIVGTVTNFTGHCGNTFDATRTWLATDAAGNTATCSQTVTVVDTTPPGITCVTDKTVECGTAWSFDSPSGLDACGGTTIQLVNTFTNHTCGHTFMATRIWHAVDACGNVSINCSQTVTVVDTTPPTIVCSPNLTNVCTGVSGAVVTFTTTATDGCGPDPVPVCTPASGSTFPEGTTLVNCTVNDGCGNQDNCAFSVTVNNTAPAPTLTIVQSGANVVVSWPATCTTYDLEKATILPNWGPSGASVVVDGARYYSTNLHTGTAFYRLHKP